MRTVLGNFLGLQLCWFCCVLGGARGLPWLGPAVVAAAVALYLGRSPRPRREAVLVLGSGALGTALDSALAAAGYLQFPAEAPRLGLAPVWMAALWMIFATAVPTSLRWMRGRYGLGALVGAIAGPLSYLGGARLGAVTLLPEPTTALAAVSLEWMAALPALLALEAALLRPELPPASESAP